MTCFIKLIYFFSLIHIKMILNVVYEFEIEMSMILYVNLKLTQV